MQNCLRIHEKDNVAVALKPLEKGQVLHFPEGLDLVCQEDIPQGHKIALRSLIEGEAIIKYGARIGLATADIPQGTWIHTHNIRTGLGEVLDYRYEPDFAPLSAGEQRHFQGYRRPDGRVGIRNEIWIIPTVGCVNNIAQHLERQGSQRFVRGSVEAVYAFPHPYGCSQMGDDQENTRKILSALIQHPNAAAVLVLGLGCENSGIEVLKGYLGDYDQARLRFLNCQDSTDELAEGLELLEELAAYAGQFQREEIPASELVVGLKCGGSDGLSGITANPTVGRFSDLLIAQGGSTILTEVPEMFGAETQLMARCSSEELFHKTVALINDFKEYFMRHGQTIYENPSPGNKQGGISTLEDKSLGCTQKSGNAPISGVLAYGEPLQAHGLNLLSAPGNDLVAATALAASGAHMVLFTTGRGTPFACPVPTLKISTNNRIYEQKKNWIDYNCGTMVDGVSLDELGQGLLDLVLSVASGQKLKSEEAGFHDMAIFKQGVTL